MATYEKCARCQLHPTLAASLPRLCRVCARELGICLYCGKKLKASEKEEGVCSWCMPNQQPGMGNSVRGWERADQQYHGSLIE